MATFNIEGDLDNISERQLQYINEIILEHGYQDSKVILEAVGKAGDNFVANVKRVKIEGPNGSINMIAKFAPTVETVRQAMNTLVLFKNEHIMYTEVLKKFTQLQHDADIPEKERLRYAKCYGSLSEAPHEVIVLEDLKTSNFIMLDRFTPISSDCIKSVLKNFAILHSLSFALRHKEPETYDCFKTSLVDFWSLLNGMEQVETYFQLLEEDTSAMLEEKQHADFIRHKLTNIMPLAAKFAKLDLNNRYTVIQQGDSWTNNIMFKFEGDKLLDSIMIDYQLSKNSSPACDIMYLIFNCTDHETRKKHFNDWIDYYHTELEKKLSYFNLKANLVYPRDRLDVDLKQYSRLQFGFCVLIGTVLIRKTDDAARIQEAMKSESLQAVPQQFLVSALDEDSKTLFRKRTVGLIESFTELGLL